MFDSLMYLKNLEAVGVSRAQAEVYAGALIEIINGNLATKEDLAREMLEVKTDFASLRGEFAQLHVEFSKLSSKVSGLSEGLKSLENRLLLKQAGLILTFLGAYEILKNNFRF
jgi:predicted nuclease with TOPRIM domain